MNVARMQMGATTDGTTAALQDPRKSRFTRATRARAMPMVTQTS